MLVIDCGEQPSVWEVAQRGLPARRQQLKLTTRTSRRLPSAPLALAPELDER